jgi:hypothetical protein
VNPAQAFARPAEDHRNRPKRSVSPVWSTSLVSCTGNISSRFAGLLGADARTRTGDPFITSFGPLSPPVTSSHFKSLLAPDPRDRK